MDYAEPTPFIFSQCKFFQNDLHLSPPNSLYERAPSAPSLHTYRFVFGLQLCWFSCMPQSLVLFLDSMWLNKSYLSEKLLALKIIV